VMRLVLIPIGILHAEAFKKKINTYRPEYP